MHGDIESLRQELVKYIKRKFSNLQDIQHTAEDIVNQAFAQCMSSKGFDPSKLNFGYLAKTCTFIAYSQYQWEKRSYCYAELEVFDEEDKAHESEVSPEQEVLMKLDQDFIISILAKQRPVDQRILYLRYFADYTFAEIATELEINLNTVLSCHRRCLAKLKPRFSYYFNDSDQ